MQQLKWVDELPEQTLEGGIRLLNELEWNLDIRQTDNFWHISAGHRGLLKTSSRESVDAFLYGVALAYSVIPKQILDQIRNLARHAAE
jgi:predicted DNA-binding transcriptional regulator